MKNNFNFRTLFNVLSVILTLVIFVFLFKKLSSEFSKINLKTLSFNVKYLILSFFFVPLWFSLLSYAYKFILSSMNEKISMIDSMRIIGLSTFGRYIPGKVWFTVGRTLLAERIGISKRKAFSAVVIETVYLVLTGLLFFVFIFRYLNNYSLLYLIIFPLFYIFVSSIKPVFFVRLMNFVLKLFKKESIVMDMPVRDVFFLNLIYIFMWIGFGFQYFFLLKSIGICFDNIYTLAIYPVSWVLGFLVIFIPSGIGIREGVMVFFLSQVISSHQAIAVSVLSRIQMTLSEILFLLTLIKSDSLWRNKK